MNLSKRVIQVLKSPYTLAKYTLKSGLAIDQHKEIFSATKHHLNHIERNVTKLKKSESRDPYRPGAPDMTNWAEVQKYWGFEDEDEPRIIKGMCAEALFYSILGLGGVYVLLTDSGLFGRYAASLLVALGLVVGISRFWKIQIIYKNEFCFFKDWFLFGAFSWLGKETPIHKSKRV